MASITINDPKHISIFVSQDGDIERFKKLLTLKVTQRIIGNFYQRETVQGGELGTEFEIVGGPGRLGLGASRNDIEQIVEEFLEAAE